MVGKQAKLKMRFVAKKEGKTRHEVKMEALQATKAAAAAAAAAGGGGGGGGRGQGGGGCGGGGSGSG